MNRVKELLKSGKTVVGTAGSVFEDNMSMLANSGLDFILFDTQHSPVEVKQYNRALQATSGAQASPLVRVSANSADLICFALDIGARGIVVPMVNTKEEAEAVIDCCYFSPVGHRSYTSKRVMRFGLEKDLKAMMNRTNDDLLVMPQIEDIKAYNNLDEILTVDGINVFAGGPNDLAQSMGYPGEPNHPDCIKVTNEGTEKIHAAGKYRNDDVMVSVDATLAVRDSVAAMLKSGDGILPY